VTLLESAALLNDLLTIKHMHNNQNLCMLQFSATFIV